MFPLEGGGDAIPCWNIVTVPSGAMLTALTSSPAFRAAAMARRTAASVKGRGRVFDFSRSLAADRRDLWGQLQARSVPRHLA